MKRVLCFLLTASILLFMLTCASDGTIFGSTAESITDTVLPDTTTAEVTTEVTAEVTTEPETTVPETTEAVTTPPQTQPPVTAPPETLPPIVTEPVTPAPPEAFRGSLFIGDSRTVGLQLYAGIQNAQFFASTGMNVFRLFSEVLYVEGFGETTLENLLRQRLYDRVYLMLGINEIGCDHGAVIGKYTEIVNTIRTLQPQAILYIEANLRIVASRSAVDSVYNNANMNDLNTRMAALADGVNIKYIDANPLFDDGNGALDSRYTFDDFHLNTEHYIRWGAWIALNQ